MLCMTDSKGRAMWIAPHREHFKRSCEDLRRNGERYRIVPRTVSAQGASVTVWVLTIFPREG